MKAGEKISEIKCLFEKRFKRPTSFFNEHCCVDNKIENVLLAAPLNAIGRYEIEIAFQHAEGCFGTFDEMVYFLPRALELYNIDDWDLCYGLFRFIIKNKNRFISLSVFDEINEAMHLIFRDRTSVFTIIHHDEKMCREKSWVTGHYDYLEGIECIEDMMEHYFFELYKDEPTAFELFIDKWAKDTNVHRLLHFLHFARECIRSNSFPKTARLPFLPKYTLDPDVINNCLRKTSEIRKYIKSPTWEIDLRSAFSSKGLRID